MSYPQVEPQPNFPSLENQILEFWKTDDTFKASVESRDAGSTGENEFVFYDGPPFANGLPHYGHLLTGFVKDAVPRYRTMRGQRVERRFGWDCHGLPAEAEAERQLEISGRQAITDFGIEKFNDYCRTSVLRYTSDWERYVTRQARWVDFENDYKTLDTPYMESVMWAFKTLWEKGLIYEGFRVLPYSWALETPLSNTETRMDDAYKQVQDPALTVAFELSTGEFILAWTTTPWTLPSNLALAVSPDVQYVVIEHDHRKLILANDRLGAYEREFGEPNIVQTLLGSQLVGRTYKPLFDYFADNPNSFRIIAGDFVTTEDGTGVVHLAPGFGEDDQRVCQDAGIELVVPVDSRGCFTTDVADFAGQLVFDANPAIIRVLKERGVVIRHETYDHAYPHCWRTGKPLIYMAVGSWFVKVTAIRDRMVELNEQVRWVPDHLKNGSFGKWLENARDWTISRNRFWGSPIPIWRSDDPNYPRIDVYGSIAELSRDFGVDIQELHRPTIDNLVRPNPDDPSGKAMMRRVPEVLDCWFESGSMPFAQVHYPFENQEWFENHYPGDFIVEYIGQTRGWFYTLHVLATALFDRPAFSNCVSHGIVLGDDGAKMSKSLRNYPDPMKVFESHGADAMRWYLLSSSILRGSDFAVTEEGMRDTVRQVMLPLWNSWYFLSLYANAESVTGHVDATSKNVLDRYIISKLHTLVKETTKNFDEYDLFAGCNEIRVFLDVLTNWYIRRSRDRFWKGDASAINTLHTVLHVLTRVAAPVLPLVSENIFRGLTGERSVHLQSWPTTDGLEIDEKLSASMDLVRDVCSTTLSLRKVHSRRVRQPLASLTIATENSSMLKSFVDIISDEVNVRKISFTDDVSSVAEFQLQVVPSVVGPRLGANTQQVIKAVKSGDWVRNGDVIKVNFQAGNVATQVELQPGEYQLKLVPKASGASAALATTSGVVVLDIDLTPELEAEGVARDVIRLVQQQRRDAGLDVSDRISLRLGLPNEHCQQISVHHDVIKSETLATQLEVFALGKNEPTNADLDGVPVFVAVNPIS